MGVWTSGVLYVLCKSIRTVDWQAARALEGGPQLLAATIERQSAVCLCLFRVPVVIRLFGSKTACIHQTTTLFHHPEHDSVTDGVTVQPRAT